MEFSTDRLTAALQQVPSACWSQPSHYGTTGVHHGARRVVVVGTGGQRKPVADLFSWVLDEFEPVHAAHLSRLDPGGFIVPHIDKGPWCERWHVPITTAGSLVDDAEPVEGQPFRLQHHLPHSVWNPTDRPRVHLIIDVDREVDHPWEPFQLFPIPERWKPLVEGVTDAS